MHSVVPKRRHDDNHNVDKKPRINQTENVETDAVSTENKLNPENSESSNDEDYVEVSNSAESSNSPEISDESIDDELNMLKNSELTNNKPANMNMVSDKPVYDSGCTAVVALLSFEHKTISVINIGDSRCVLCRDGKAMDLSVDHKPEDTIERSRIEKAGGCVTEDGRVNGGLNLSRAFGDHTYKINKSLSHEDQMITPKPDVKTVKLVKEDEFMIIACDGIWNVMTSEEIISFVSERLNDKNNKMSINDIISAVFDKCISPDTLGDGSGCDNMTCIIVQFKDSFLKGTESMYVHETK
ncbi:hypothetical protein A3Q56_01635 [Intoshia linei]|uniref:protein-serine/threonine phosphatase n=1 Tax=Intoshia linei TaxID=1819745 RepID=A0A177B8I9_9BILA|nr:hypothetical protein A3Q56_01635 [Intoshia linei]